MKNLFGNEEVFLLLFSRLKQAIMKNFRWILIVLLVLFTTVSNAQIGIGTISPNGVLDITSTTDGLIIPRVALTITTNALPLTSPTTSELVYNTATVTDVTPGYYY